MVGPVAFQPPVAGAAAQDEDQTSITWSDPNYPPLIDRYRALHYFEQSTFFDSTSNNMETRKQQRDPALLGALEFAVPNGGLEYVVDVEQPPNLFVIRKQQRRGPDTSLPGAVTPLAFYYILDRIIYQAPSLHAVLSCRIRRCVWALHQGFDKLQADLNPLVKLCREHREQQEAAEARQGAAEDGTAGALVAVGSSAVGSSSAGGSVQLVEALPAPVGAAGGAAAGGSAGGAARGAAGGVAGGSAGGAADGGAADVAPLPIRPRVHADELAYWKRTDNMIMTALSGYQTPALPDVYYEAQRAAWAQQFPGAPAGATPPAAATEPAAAAAGGTAAAAGQPAGAAAGAGARGAAGAGGEGASGRGGGQRGGRGRW